MWGISLTNKKLENLAYRLKDLNSLRNLFSELNFDFADKPVDKDNWSENQKKIVTESRIIASKNDYQIYYIQTDVDSLKELKEIASKIIKSNHGFCMICSHHPNGFKWIFSNLSKEFSKSFTESRHVPLDISPDAGVPKNFVEFLDSIKVTTESTASSILHQMSEAFDSFAVQIHNELTVNVFEALRILSEGIILDKSNKMTLDEQTLEQIREPVFILLYRIIFILYAEDRNIFPIDNKTYYDEFSIKWLKKHRILNTSKAEEYSVLDRLSKFFRLIELGSEDLGYDPEQFFMKSYYGRLFDRKIHSKLDQWKIKDKYLLDAISLLTRTRDKNENYFFLDYSALETRHLGSVYEHLLEYHLTIKDKKIADLPDAKDRKTSGSYYTPQHIVDYIVENTVGPLIDDIIKKNSKDEQIDKILELNILDPAMGSGHFLIGVTNYMAQRICEIEYDKEYLESAFIERKRDVVRRCVYGVDLNPLAVDLAQVSLWLETLSSEKPLSFLSAHLKSGNSLIGSSIDVILDKQTTLMESSKGRRQFKKTVKDFIILEQLEDDTASAVKAKTEKYDEILSKGTIYYDLKFLLDVKVAKDFGVDVPPIGDYVAKIGESSLDFYADERWQQVKKVSQEHSFFHWDLEFPDIFYDESGKRKKNLGFDGVVGNPPWQIVKPDVDEFFSPRYNLKNSEQKFSMLTKNKKNKFVKECLEDKKIKDDYDLYNRYYEKQMKYFNMGSYNYQSSLVNGKKQSSDLNLYKLFIEKSYALLSQKGLCGFVIPSGIYSDLGSKGLREMLLENTEIKSLYSFINKKGIFEGVHRQFKFCLIVFARGGSTDRFLASFYLEDASVLQNHKQIAYDYDVKHIQTMSPNSLSFLECKNESEFEILKKLYKYPLLGSKEWDLRAAREFDMTNDSKLFHTTKVGYPLYEGKMMNMFTNTFAKPRYWIKEKEGRTVLESKERNRMRKITKDNSIYPRIDCDEYRLVWRSITNSTNERTLISTILPPNLFLGNSLNYLKPLIFDVEKYILSTSYEEMFFLCGIFNSFVIDFVLRHKVATNLNIFYLMELPIPRYDKNNILHKNIVENTAKIICTTDEFSKLRNSLGISDYETQSDKRLTLESQINACVAKIYDLDNDDLKLILKNFPITNEQLKELSLNEFSSQSNKK